MKRAILSLALAAMALPAAAAPAAGDEVVGLWRNQRNTMHIDIHHCGDSVCGRVVWANDEALADARRGGTPNLIGTDIFHDFRRDTGGKWRGKVFVPDIGKTFSGTLEMTDRDMMKGSGCLLGRVLCKAKVLVRMR